MARGGVNKVTILGRLGADPEARYMPSGEQVTNIRVATSESWKDKETGDQQERTEWHSIVAYGGLAKVLSEYTSKGKQVYIEGSLRTRKWQDKEGKDRYTTEIVARDITLLDSAGSSSRGSDDDRDARDAPARSHSNKKTETAKSNKGRPRQPDPDPDNGADLDFDDDIPF